MLPFSQRIAFGIFAVLCVLFAGRGFWRMVQRIRRGRADADRRSDRPFQRAWYALRTTLTQSRVFRRRPFLSFAHLFIFYAFVLYLLVNAVDAVEGFASPRIFEGWNGSVAYRALTDFLSVAALLAVILFVLRRFVLPSRRDFRFNARTLLAKEVRRGSTVRDSVIVSVFILFHIGSRVVGNAARLAMQGSDAAQPFSSLLAPALAGPHAMVWRIAGYWGALGSVLLFLVYFPYSKHIHLLMAPVKYFFRRAADSGELPSLRLDLQAEKPELGASTLAELTWPRLLDGYACIQCNRCQDVCPASATGKALSPAALEINKRSALNAIAREVSPFSLRGAAPFESGQSDGPGLLDAVISPEAVWGCTTCGACLEVCPTGDEPMLDIVDLRRNLVLEQGSFPSQLQTAFRGMERNKNPWGLSPKQRMVWAEGLEVPTIDEVPHPDVLYWVGCAASYDPAAQKTARAVVQLLREGGVRFAVLGERETCTGDSARRAGNELLYQDLAQGAMRTLNAAAPKQILASCPHCVNVIGAEFRQMGGDYVVQHHTEYLAGMLAANRIRPRPSQSAITYHDPCYLGRHRGTYEEPRALLHVLTNDVVELDRNRANAFCCGAGGAQFWKEEEPGDERVSENRFREVQATLASRPAPAGKVLAVGCPFCKSMLQSTPAAGEDGSIVIKDVAELLWEGVRPLGAESSAVATLAPSGPEAPPRQDVAPAVERAQAWSATKDAEPAVVAALKQSESTGEPVSEAARMAAPASQTAEALPSRKKWAPKVKLTPDQAAGSGEAGTSNVSAAPAAGPGPDSASETATGPASAPRKKWQPRREQ